MVSISSQPLCVKPSAFAPQWQLLKTRLRGPRQLFDTEKFFWYDGLDNIKHQNKEHGMYLS